ncbi:hypothetical protein Q427_07925 [Halomonas sp. BC04]|nr:hypothetical protein Q427_07925 [Halomonas sp. BC04]
MAASMIGNQGQSLVPRLRLINASNKPPGITSLLLVHVRGLAL